MDLKLFFKNHKEIILYLFFGGLTTLVSISSYALLRLAISIKSAQILSWITAVLFAYVTNKIFVFESKQDSFLFLLKEFLLFISARLFTGAMEFFSMIFLIKETTPRITEIIIKSIVTVIVIILNYILSKILIFVKKEVNKNV